MLWARQTFLLFFFFFKTTFLPIAMDWHWRDLPWNCSRALLAYAPCPLKGEAVGELPSCLLEETTYLANNPWVLIPSLLKRRSTCVVQSEKTQFRYICTSCLRRSPHYEEVSCHAMEVRYPTPCLAQHQHLWKGPDWPGAQCHPDRWARVRASK